MAVYINNIKSIKQFILRTDKALVAQVLDDILGANHFYCFLEGGDKIYYLFANYKDESEKSEAVQFWIANIRNYNYLFVYAMLFWWTDQWEDDEELKNKLMSFQNRFSKTLEKEIEDFINKTESIPPSIIHTMGFVIDTFLWVARYDVPFFLEGQEHSIGFSQPNIDRYFELFRINIPADSVTNKIKKSVDSLLFYFKVFSIIAKFKNEYPAPMAGNTGLPWNWDVIISDIENRCREFCKLGHKTFFFSHHILNDFDLRNIVVNKRKKAAEMFIKEIKAAIVLELWNPTTAKEIINNQKKNLQEIVEKLQSNRIRTGSDKSREKKVKKSVLTILSDTYIFNFQIDDYYFNNNRELITNLPPSVLNEAKTYAQTHMSYYISSSFLWGESIKEDISYNEEQILDKIVKEDLYKALVESMISYVKKQINMQYNKK